MDFNRKVITADTEQYYYDFRHLLYLLIRHNPDFSVRDKTNSHNKVFGRYEIICCSLSPEYINSIRGQVTDDPKNCFVICIPGPEKVYNFRGIEKQVDTRNVYVYVSINQITGDILFHWDEEYFNELTRHFVDLDSLNWCHYKIPMDISMGKQYDIPDGPITFNPYIPYEEEEDYEE